MDISSGTCMAFARKMCIRDSVRAVSQPVTGIQKRRGNEHVLVGRQRVGESAYRLIGAPAVEMCIRDSSDTFLLLGYSTFFQLEVKRGPPVLNFAQTVVAMPIEAVSYTHLIGIDGVLKQIALIHPADHPDAIGPAFLL